MSGLGKVAGVYVVFGPRGVYVGEATDILRRSTVVVAHRLGLDWFIVRQLPGANKSTRVRWEAAVADCYRRAGYTVVSTKHAEVARLGAQARTWTPEERQSQTAIARARWRALPQSVRSAKRSAASILGHRRQGHRINNHRRHRSGNMSGMTGVCYLPLLPVQPVNTLGGGQAMPNVPLVPRQPRRDGSIDLEFVQNTVSIPRTVKLVNPADPLTKAWLTVKANLADPDNAAKLQKVITTATALANPGKITADGSVNQGNGTATIVFGVLVADTSGLPTNAALYYDIQVMTASGAVYTVEAGGGIGGGGGGFNWAPRVTTATS